jgi:hypothetical protein
MIENEIGMLMQHEIIVYLVSMCLGLLFGIFLVKRIGDDKRELITAGFTQSFSHEQKQALVFAVVVSCLVTALGQGSRFVDDAYLRFVFVLLILFLIGIAFVLFSVVGYALMMK